MQANSSEQHTLFPMTCIRIVSMGAMTVFDNAPARNATNMTWSVSQRTRGKAFVQHAATHVNEAMLQACRCFPGKFHTS